MNNNNQLPYNQNGQNQMNMNYIYMQNELLKCVFEGLGEQPKNSYNENLKYLMNYVPQLDESYTSNKGQGKMITLTFESADVSLNMKLKIGEDTPLSVVFKEYLTIKGINNINDYYFLCYGNPYKIDAPGTPKNNNFQENTPIVVNKYG